jgi:hypothetical protein
MRAAWIVPIYSRMQQMSAQSDYRLLDAVMHVSALTDAEPTLTARERLEDLLGYRLYRALVSSLGG